MIRVPDDRDHGYNTKIVTGDSDRHSAHDGLPIDVGYDTTHLGSHGDIAFGKGEGASD